MVLTASHFQSFNFNSNQTVSKFFSGKDDHFACLALYYDITIFSNGSMWAESSESTFSTWCSNSNRNWPHEIVDCNIQIQLEHFIDAALVPLEKAFYIIPKVSKFIANHFEINFMNSIQRQFITIEFAIIWFWWRWVAYNKSGNHINNSVKLEHIVCGHRWKTTEHSVAFKNRCESETE